MCGRIVSTTPTGELLLLFDAAASERVDDTPRYNVAPTDPVRVVVERAEGRTIETRRWGLVPHWTTVAEDSVLRINARAETVTELPAFRDAFVGRRCIVPADGFYEWRDGRPHLIRRADGRPLVFAGLRATDRDGVQTCTIVTTAADATLHHLHDRMPVMLAADAFGRWLDPAERDTDRLRRIVDAPPPVVLEIFEVSRAVSNVRNDGPHLIEPAPVQDTLFG